MGEDSPLDLARQHGAPPEAVAALEVAAAEASPEVRLGLGLANPRPRPKPKPKPEPNPRPSPNPTPNPKQVLTPLLVEYPHASVARLELGLVRVRE